MKRAILIGINYTGTNSELRGCVNDTKNVFMWLVQECGYKPENIRTYTDEEHVPENRKPYRKNIEDGIKWLHESAISSTSPVELFMHYSGHGSWTYDKNGDEGDGKDESICPLDYNTAGCILDDQLKVLVVDPISRNPNVSLTCLFDCCHSGTALDLRYDFDVRIDSKNPDTRSFSMKQNKSCEAMLCNLILWSGCLDDQTSADAYIERNSQGAMTWGFLSVVRKRKAKGKVLSYKRALAELQILLAGKGYEQIPHLSSGRVLNLSDEVKF
jgi:metacaspase-1